MFDKVLIRLTSKLGEGSDFINTDQEDSCYLGHNCYNLMVYHLRGVAQSNVLTCDFQNNIIRTSTAQ